MSEETFLELAESKPHGILAVLIKTNLLQPGAGKVYRASGALPVEAN